MNKIFYLDSLAEYLKRERTGGKRIVLCHGVFDLLHLGHIRHLQEAKSFGDLLVVTITPDEYVNRGPGRPVFSEELRAEAVAAIGAVDYVAINKWPIAVETIKALKPDVYVKGPDYQDKSNDLTGNITIEEEAVKAINGEVRYTSDITFSSTQLLNQYYPLFTDEQKSLIERLKENYVLDDILQYFEKMTKLKVLLVGEVILDEYVTCNTLGKAGKDPILTLQKLDSEMYAGGILAIGNHLSDFCQSLKILSYLGQEMTNEEFVKENLRQNVSIDFILKSGSPTIVKRKYINSDKQSKIIGIYDINDELINESEEELFCKKLEENLPQFDAVIVADYGHGLITPRAIEVLTEKSRFLAVNTQLNSANIGFHTISRYKKANYICMHEGELRHDFRSREKSLKELAMNLYSRVESDVITVTEGARGGLSYSKQEGFVNCPAFASKVVDKMGAGDSLFAITSLCFAVGMPIDLTLFIGNLAAAEIVATIGNSKSINRVELLKAIDSFLK